jgi:hypothetical protein
MALAMNRGHEERGSEGRTLEDLLNAGGRKSHSPVFGEFLEIMRQWESDRVRDNAAGTRMKQSLAQPSHL